ncbi:microtubule-associated protein 4 [Sarotherodon galilaeus]
MPALLKIRPGCWENWSSPLQAGPKCAGFKATLRCRDTASASTDRIAKGEEGEQRGLIRTADVDVMYPLVGTFGARLSRWSRLGGFFVFVQSDHHTASELSKNTRQLSGGFHPADLSATMRLTSLTGLGEGITRRRSESCPGLSEGTESALCSPNRSRLGIQTMLSN